MDDELLGEARRARERLIGAEHDAEVARGEFHRAVLDLQRDAPSLRDIGAALGLSHQRVHQIVEVADGTRRLGRRRNPWLDLACTFCGRPQSEVHKLISVPGIYICEACVKLAEGALSSGSAATTQLGQMLAVPKQDRHARCRFCGKGRDEVAGLAAISVEASGKEASRAEPKAAGRAAICSECLSFCDETIGDQSAAAHGSR